MGLFYSTNENFAHTNIIARALIPIFLVTGVNFCHDSNATTLCVVPYLITSETSGCYCRAQVFWVCGFTTHLIQLVVGTVFRDLKYLAILFGLD